MNVDALAVYLKDHLAGSAAGIDLAQRLQAQTDGTPLGEVMAGLVADIQADRETLEGLMKELDIDQGGLKQAAGKVVEKLARVRTDKRITGDAALSRMMEWSRCRWASRASGPCGWPSRTWPGSTGG